MIHGFMAVGRERFKPRLESGKILFEFRKAAMTDRNTDRSFDIPGDYVGPELEFEFDSDPRRKRRIIAGILLFGLIVAALVFVFYRFSEPSAEEFFTTARTHFGERKFRASVIELKNALQKEPAYAAARLLLGRSYLELGQPASAEKELRHAGDLGAHPADLVTPLGRALLMQGRHERILEVFDVDEQMSAPHRAAVLVLRGDASRGLDRYRDAERSYREAQIHDPENVSASVGLAALALDTNEPTAAEALAAAALEAVPQTPRVLGLKGDIHFARGRFEEAEQMYRQLVALQPDNPFNLILLAQAQLGTGELENAIGNLDRVLEVAPREPAANFLRAMAAYNLKDYPTATRRSEQALELAPEHLPSLMLAGAANFAEGKYERAYKHLSKFVARTGSSPGDLARKMLGTTLLQIDRNEAGPPDKRARASGETTRGSERLDVAQKLDTLAAFYDADGRHAAARRLYQRAQAIREKTLGSDHPDVAQSLNDLALIYADQGRYAQAAQMIFEPLVDRSPEDAELLSLISSAALRSGDLESGRRYLERLSAARPDDARPRAVLGNVNVGLGDVDRGIEELERAVAQDPELDSARIALVLSYLRERRFDEALENAQRVQEIKPDNPMGATLAGLTFFAKGEVDKARAAFLKALEIDPSAMDASGNLAALEIRDGNSDRAREVLKAALEQIPGHFSTLWRLATLETRLQRWEEAEAWARMALQARPEALEARILLAKLHLRGGDAVQALAIAESYVEAHSDNVELIRLVGQAYLAAGRAAEAASPLRFLVEAEPDSIEAHGLLATSYRILNDVDRYKEQLERILEIDPNHPRAKVRLAGIAARQGDVGSAARMLRELKETGFDDPLVLELDGVIALKEKRFADAVVLFGQAVERRPTTGLMLKVVVAQDGAGDARAALDTLKTWLARFPEDIAARKVLAERHLSASRFEEARSDYLTVLELAPGDVLARNNLAWVLLRLGEPRLALPHAERALAQLPDDPTVMDTAGLILVELGETERALGLLREAAKREPTNSTMRYHLAGALAREGATREAEQILREILSEPTEFTERADAKSLLERLAD